MTLTLHPRWRPIVVVALALLGLVLALAFAGSWSAFGQDQDQANTPVIVRRVDGATGKCIFTVQFPRPTDYVATLWTVHGVMEQPKLIEGNAPFVYYFPEAGTYTVDVLVFFRDAPPARASITFDVLPLGNPVAKQLDWAKDFVVRYVLPALAVLAVLFGVKLQ